MKLLCAALLLAGTLARAADAVPVVVVPGAKNLTSWPYRTLAKGLDAFEAGRAHAPQALLTYHLRPVQGAGTYERLELYLVGPDWQAPVDLRDEGRFTLSRDARAEAADAHLVINRKRDQYDPATIPLAEVRTPGLAGNVVRLGDLRLQCAVNQAIAKAHLGWMASMAINALGGLDWCAPRKGKGYAAVREQPFVQAMLGADGRRLVLHEGAPRRSVSVPIDDDSWPDEALLEFR